MEALERKILSLIVEDSRYTGKELAAMTGETERNVKEAITRMENRGVIVKYTAVIDEEGLGTEKVEALIEVKVTPQHSRGFDALAEEIHTFDEVKSVFLMSGAYDLAVFIKGKTLRDIAMFVSEKLSVMENVLSTATHFILKKYKIDGVVLGSARPERLAVLP